MQRILKFFILALCFAGFYAWLNWPSSDTADQTPATRDTILYSGNGYEFRYPEGWHVSAGKNQESTTTLPLYISKYPHRDEYGIVLAEEGAATFDDLLRELKETTVLPIEQERLDEKPLVQLLSYVDSQDVFEKAFVTTSNGAVSVSSYHSLDDTERHNVLLLVAKTFRRTE